jgi:hypothetical protein
MTISDRIEQLKIRIAKQEEKLKRFTGKARKNLRWRIYLKTKFLSKLEKKYGI